MAPKQGSKKAAEGINARLQIVMRSGRYTLGLQAVPEDAAQGTVEARADLEQLPGAAQERDRVLRDVGEDRGASLRRKCVREATDRRDSTREDAGGGKP